MVGPAAAAAAETDVSSPRLQVGDVLVGRFQVSRFIAQGGMGAVYEASDSLLKTRVALKVIRGISADAGALERFRREVLLARRVSHPNVCRVYELYVGLTSTGAPIHFLTMELLEGESLAQRLARQGRLTTAEALPLVRQMCEGLAAAHAEGVIHRDFKSSNVMLAPRTAAPGEAATDVTRVVITDFGVARAVHLATEEVEEESLTGRAGILGTPEYMAPEQVTGGEVTAAADIYALGVVVYEMVTGKLPFVGDTPLAAAARRLDEAPPRADASVPGLDRRWVEAILRCLARQPERRFKSARDVIPVLEKLPGHRRRVQALAVGAVLLMLLGAFAVVRYRPSLRLGAPQRSAVLAAPRPLVAILGFRNELPSPKLKWLPTAVTELLAHELAAAERSLRVNDTDDLYQWGLRSLGVPERSVGNEKSQRRLEAVLGADVLVHGALAPVEPGSDDVRLHLEALDAETRKPRTSYDVDLGPGAARLLEAVAGAGAYLREALGASMSTEEEAALFASRARNHEAVQAYAEGVERLRDFEYEDARSHFEAALAASPSFLDAQRRIAESWGDQRDRKHEREAWQRIRARSDGLTARRRAEVDATLLGLGSDAQKARDAWLALFEAMPDDTDTAMRIMESSPPRVGLELIRRVRQVHGPHLLLDVYEAIELDETGDSERAQELLTSVVTRARELGARFELGFPLRVQGDLFYRHGRGADALERYREAERAFADSGLLPHLALVKNQQAMILSELGPDPEALVAWDETLGLRRRLGHRRGVAQALAASADLLVGLGELELARGRLEEARTELEALGEPLLWMYFQASAELALEEADLRAVLEVIRQARSGSDVPLGIEGHVLFERDRLEEARSTYLRLSKEAEHAGLQIQVLGGAYLACAVDCSGAQPATGVACLAPLCRSASLPLAIGPCLREEALCRYRVNDLVGAERAARDALTTLGSHQGTLENVLATATLMRIEAARGNSEGAIRGLKRLLANAEAKHQRSTAFNIALALGDAELRARRPEGRPRLLRLEQEARSREYFRIARLARELLDQKPGASAQPVR